MPYIMTNPSARLVRDAKAILRDIGVDLHTTEHSEFRVNLKGGAEVSAYYTADLNDAVQTGIAMAKPAAPCCGYCGATAGHDPTCLKHGWK